MAIGAISTQSKILKISKWVSTGTKISWECFHKFREENQMGQILGVEFRKFQYSHCHWKFPEIQAGIFQ